MGRFGDVGLARLLPAEALRQPADRERQAEGNDADGGDEPKRLAAERDREDEVGDHATAGDSGTDPLEGRRIGDPAGAVHAEAEAEGQDAPQVGPRTPSVREAGVQQRGTDAREEGSGNHHPGTESAVRPSEDGGHQEEERQADEEDGPPAEDVIAHTELADEADERLAGKNDHADDEQEEPRQELDGATHGAEYTVASCRGCPAGPAFVPCSGRSAGVCPGRAEACMPPGSRPRSRSPGTDGASPTSTPSATRMRGSDSASAMPRTVDSSSSCCGVRAAGRCPRSWVQRRCRSIGCPARSASGGSPSRSDPCYMPM